MAVVFDGSNDYLQRSGVLFGAGSSDKFSFSCWGRISGGDATARTILEGVGGGNTYFEVQLDSSNNIDVLGADSGATTIFQNTSATAYAASSTWLHIACTVDLPAAGNLYVNRTSDGTDTTSDSGDVAFASATTWTVGARSDASQKFNGEIYDLILWTGVAIDLTDADELRRIVSSDGLTDYANPGPTAGTPKPVGYGARADIPTGGIRPAIYFSGPFTRNRGTGGAFTITGALASSRGPAHYRQHALRTTPGERWFDSDRSGFSAPRSETFIESREGIPAYGQRNRVSERDDTTRDERPGLTFSRLLLGDREDDSEDRKTKRG